MGRSLFVFAEDQADAETVFGPSRLVCRRSLSGLGWNLTLSCCMHYIESEYQITYDTIDLSEDF